MNRKTIRPTRVAAASVATLAAGAALRPLAQRRWHAYRAVPSDLRSPLLLLPLHFTSVRGVRLMAKLPVPAPRVPADVRHEVRTVPGRDGRPDVPVHLYRPSEQARQPSPALYWTHGGGFVMGSPTEGHEWCARVVRELGVTVASVDYRLAPEHPFPEGLEDSYTGLLWLAENADDLGLDTTRIAVGGDSAGGGLAACLAQLALDRAELTVCFQLLVYPMLDDRTVLREDHGGTGEVIWSPISNRFGWTSYLGRPPLQASAPDYAAAARREDLSDLPPAWIGVGDLDLFFAEDVFYADRLRAAGVPCTLTVVPGMYHAADQLGRAQKSAAMAKFNRTKLEALRAGLFG